MKNLALATFALAALVGAESFSAQDSKDGKKTVLMIADFIKKGQGKTAKQMAVAKAKDFEEVADLMHLHRPVNKGGLGLDVILRQLAKKADDRVAAAAAPLTAAMAELTLAKAPSRDFPNGRTKLAWTEFATQMRDASAALAKAAVKTEGKFDAKGVTAAAGRINQSCNGCHAFFKQ